MNKLEKIVVLGAGTAGLIAALMLNRKYPNKKIDVIKSSEIGIVGVGEGSTEHWKVFCDYVGIEIPTMVKETSATIKIGILFNDWNGVGHQYVHSVTGHTPLSASGNLNASNYLAYTDSSSFNTSPGFERFFYQNRIPLAPNLVGVSNQYHFDTFKLNVYLTDLCMQRGIQFHDTVIEQVDMDERGYITSIAAETGERFTADIFIDCSGFKRVIASEMDVEWVSFTKYLPMNHAIAFPTEFEEGQDYEPYTTSTALSSGWIWKIPTQHRYGNGYVFSDNYITTDQALGEAEKHLGKKIEKVGRDIKFGAGRVDQFWKNNCICFGLSGGFAEPLEAQSIGFAIQQGFALVECIDGWPTNNSYVSKRYNQSMNVVFDNVIDYLQAHYFTKRDDTPFWKEKPFEWTEFNKDTFEIFAKGDITNSYFESKYSMFRAHNFHHVYNGLGLIDKEHAFHHLSQFGPFEMSQVEEAVKQAKTCVADSTRGMSISHKAALDLLIENYDC